MKPVFHTSSNDFTNLSFSTQQNTAANSHRLIPINQSSQTLLMCSSSIAYARSEHVYVEIHFGGSRKMLHRDSLTGLMKILPGGLFVQVHRSYVVNLKRVDGWRNDSLLIGSKVIPISRNRRQKVLAQLQLLQ